MTIGTINNSYSTGNVSGTSYVGGLTGQNYGIITSSYYLITSADQSTFVDWDFENVWGINEGESYPFFIYTINFDSRGGTAVNTISRIPHNTTIAAPTAPTRTHFTFAGWYRDVELTTPWDFENDVVRMSRTLYAKWEPIPFMVTFDSRGGTAVEAVVVNSGNLIERPSDPTKEFYRFRGWSIEENSDNFWNFASNTVTQDTTLYAIWRSIYADNEIDLFDTVYIYSGDSIKLGKIELFSGDERITLLEDTDFSAEYENNLNAGTARATITGIGENYERIISNIAVRTLEFKIERRNVVVIWDTLRFEWNSEGQRPKATVRSEDERFSVEVVTPFHTRRNADEGVVERDGYAVRAELKEKNDNINLLNKETTFFIVRRVINIEWENTGPFVYNRMAQNPTAKTANILRDDGSVIMGIEFAVQGQYVGGRHWAEARATSGTAITRNLDWENHMRAYVIEPRELTPRLRNTGNRITTPQGLTKEQLDSILTIEIDFDNFARDTITKEADDKSVLTGRVRFNIQNDDSQNSLRSQGALASGEHIVTISGESQNYTILERKIVVIIGERFLILEDYPRATAISDVKKSDNRYGIKFAQNIVSDKAEISVILPNNERAVETKITIYDMTGNVVFSTTTRDNVSWDLRNTAGRYVANGTYLVIAEAKDRNGRTHAYSSRLGVRR